MEENKSITNGTNQHSNIWIGLVFIFGGVVHVRIPFAHDHVMKIKDGAS